MSIIETRAARVEDVADIAGIMKAVWPHSEPEYTRVSRVVQDTSHITLLAVVDNQVAGFVDGFATMTDDNVARWEVDLLAVHPDFQRRGLGTLLIKTNTEAGINQGADYARGLVAVDNVGSQKAFSICGYKTNGGIHELLVVDRPQRSSEVHDVDFGAYLIPVMTMNYAGLWIEGARQKSDLQRAIQKFAGTDYDIAGAVVPEKDLDVIENAEQLGFERVGRYQWWQRPVDG